MPESEDRGIAVMRGAAANDNGGEDRDPAASAIRGLIERIVLTPGAKWAEMDAVLHGDLGTILEWTGNGSQNTRTDVPSPEMSVSVIAGAGLEPATFSSRVCRGGATGSEVRHGAARARCCRLGPSSCR